MKKILTIFTICLSLIATSCMNIFDKDELKQKNTITFYPGTYGVGEVSSQEFELGKSQKLKKCNFTSSDNRFSFAGWSENADAAGPTYADEAEISIKEDRKFYAIWSDVNKAMYVDLTNGLDTNDGLTVGTAYKTFEPVFKKINSVDPTLPWVVNVVSDYESQIVVPKLNATNLTIQSNEGSLVTIRLPSSAASGSVIRIESNAIVTLKNIAIEDGKGTPVNSGGNTVYYGGGVYVMAGGSLTVDSATNISGNNATYGGGIYNAGTLVIKSGCSINSNTITRISYSGKGSGIYSTSNFTGMDIVDSVLTNNTPEPQLDIN